MATYRCTFQLSFIKSKEADNYSGKHCMTTPRSPSVKRVREPSKTASEGLVCAKKKPPNNGYPRRERRPRKKYSKDTEDEVDISFLYEANSVTEIPKSFVVDCTKHINRCIESKNLKEAKEVFDLMIKKGLDPSVVTYTTLMKGYSEAGDNQTVYKLFRDMEKNGVRPDEMTFSTIIHACAITGDLSKAEYLFDRMKNRYWLTPKAHIYSAMFNVCASAKDLEVANEFLEEMSSSDVDGNVIVLTAMINVYAECCNKDNAIMYLKECRELLEAMKLKAVGADVQTFNTLLKLCARGSLTVEAMAILDEMRAKNVHPNEFSYSTIIDGISKDDRLSDKEVMEFSNNVVSRMKQEHIPLDAHVYSNLINVALKIGDLSRAVGLFNEMKRKRLKFDAITYGTMIKCYAKLGDPASGDAYLKPCLDLLNECEQHGVKMDEPGYVSLLSACANVANVDTALQIWNKIEEQGVKRTVSIYNAMINVYVSVKDLSSALSLFAEMKRKGPTPDPITYGTMIKCYEKLGDPSIEDAHLKPCLDLFAECEQSGIVMTSEGYTSLLSACANVANLETALEIWSKIKEAKWKPDVCVCSAMIRVCLSADREDKALALLDEMKTYGVKPNEVTFRTFIAHFMKKKDRTGAQRIYNKMKSLGLQPDQEALRMLRALQVN